MVLEFISWSYHFFCEIQENVPNIILQCVEVLGPFVDETGAEGISQEVYYLLSKENVTRKGFRAYSCIGRIRLKPQRRFIHICSWDSIIQNSGAAIEVRKQLCECK